MWLVQEYNTQGAFSAALLLSVFAVITLFIKVCMSLWKYSWNSCFLARCFQTGLEHKKDSEVWSSSHNRCACSCLIITFSNDSTDKVGGWTNEAAVGKIAVACWRFTVGPEGINEFPYQACGWNALYHIFPLQVLYKTTSRWHIIASFSSSPTFFDVVCLFWISLRHIEFTYQEQVQNSAFYKIYAYDLAVRVRWSHEAKV